MIHKVDTGSDGNLLPVDVFKNYFPMEQWNS